MKRAAPWQSDKRGMADSWKEGLKRFLTKEKEDDNLDDALQAGMTA